MKNQTIEIIKDLIVSILILVCIVLILSVVFYDKISLSKVIPESEEYMLTEEMQQELEETNLDDAEEIIVNYYIDAADLRQYEKTNEYNKGKSNPFAAVDASTTDDITDDNTISGDANTSTSTDDNNNSENFYEDDGTK